MKKWLVVSTLVVGMILPSCVWAQGGGGGGGFGGGRQRSLKFRLGGLMRGIGDLEKGKAPLTKDQARKVVGFIKPWESKPKMTENDAKTLYMRINSVLTTKQKNELDRQAAMNRRNMGGGGGGGFGGGQGGPGGGGGGGGNFNPQQFRQQMQKMQGFFKTYNPFYPPSSYKEFKQLPDRMQERFTRSYQSRRSMLAHLAQKAR